MNISSACPVPTNLATLVGYLTEVDYHCGALLKWIQTRQVKLLLAIRHLDLITNTIQRCHTEADSHHEEL